MNYLFIGTVLTIITVVILYVSSRNVHEVKEEEQPLPKYQPRKVTIVPSNTEAPKKKKKRYYNKKKPAVANNATTEKRSVGRPRKTT